MDMLLTNLFNDMREEGYIYDEDENGQQMSYGEYAAINTAFEEALLDQLKHYYDFEQAAETLKSIMDGTTDDVRIFFDAESYDNFDYYINDNGTVDMWSVPEKLKDFFEELKERYEEEHYIEEDEDEEWEMEIA